MPQAADGPGAQSGGSRSGRLTEALRHPVFPAALAVAALLLFCWPFVRVPRLPLADAWAHLGAAWALVIVALWALSRAVPGGDRDEEGPGG
jgi:hypothetical protein